jgi:plasmid stabilization system protein ParE
MRRLSIRPQAQAEIRDIYDWYEEQQPGLGVDFEQALAEISYVLIRHPQAYPVIFGESRRALMRRFPYMVFYRIYGEEIAITACIHRRRDPGYWKPRV